MKQEKKIANRVQKESSKIYKLLRQRYKKTVKKAIEKLPFGDIKRLSGLKNEYRLRVGDLRVLFTKENDTITINDILPRGQAYNNL